MKLVACFLASLTLTACGPQSFQSHNVSSSDDAIIGGVEVQAGDPLFSSIVAVYDPLEGQLCTGSLLPNNIVVTAAHCIGMDPTLMQIFFDVKPNERSKFTTVDKVETSPYWELNQDNEKDTGDIALLHFKGPIPTGHKPAQLLTSFTKKLLKKDTQVILAGYGFTNGTTQEGAGTLRTVKVPIQDPDYSPSELTTSQANGAGACHGDSGGPAYVEIKGAYYLWGIIARGVNETKDDCSNATAYTSIQFYKSWIRRASERLNKSYMKQAL